MGDRVTSEEIQRANEVHILDYLQAKGEAIIKQGNSYYRHAEHDSLLFHENGKWYWNSRSEGGFGAISFARLFYELKFQEAVHDVNGLDIVPTISREERQATKPHETFKYPKYVEVDHVENATNYLVNVRGIDSKVVLSLHKHKLIAEDQKKNLVFKWRNAEGKVIGADRQGTVEIDNARGSFKQIVPGSDVNQGFKIDIGTPEKIAFFESPIDAISYYDLKRPTNIRLISMSGLRENTVHMGIRDLNLEMHQRNGQVMKEMIIATDNDVAGNAFAQKIVDFYELPVPIRAISNNKDWNEDLKELRGISTFSKKKELEKETNSMAYKKKTFEEKQQEIEQLTASMESKINSYFESESNIREHLAFMANFYHYSPRNMALIDNQFKGAQAVGSFNYWKEQGVSVNKGEKGIKILVPTPIEYFKRSEQNWVPSSKANQEEKVKLAKGQLETQKRLFFKVGHVFEYTQTNAREKGIPVSEIFARYHRDGTVENDREFVKALEKVADHIGVKIVDTPPQELGTAKGAYYPTLNIIALNPRNTPAENIPVLIHELAHAELHNKEKMNERGTELTTNEKEFQAEMVAYVVASRYDIPVEEFSLSYLANWTKEAELKDKEVLLNEVRKTSSSFMETMDEHFEKVNLLEKTHTLENVTKLDYHDELMVIQENNGLTSNKLELENTAFWRQLSQNNPEDYDKYMCYLSLYEYELKHGQVDIQEPMMEIVGVTNGLQPFGEANNLDLDAYKFVDIHYTVVVPEGDQLAAFTDHYERKDCVHPLHHMEKYNTVDSETYKTLESHWHNVLQREENEYINAIAPRIVAEVHARETKSFTPEQTPQKSLTNPSKKTMNMEVER